MRDETPAATIGGINECDGPPRKSAPVCVAGRRFWYAVRPASLLRKSILDIGQQASATSRPHCTIQVACHTGSPIIYCYFKLFPERARNYEACFTVASWAYRLINMQYWRLPNIAPIGRLTASNGRS